MEKWMFYYLIGVGHLAFFAEVVYLFIFAACCDPIIFSFLICSKVLVSFFSFSTGSTAEKILTAPYNPLSVLALGLV